MAQGDGGQVDWLEKIVEELTWLHDRILETSGGMGGVHSASLYSACARPFQSVFGEEAYQTPFDKAAAMFHAVICDHAFVDGNKRTATVGTISLLAAFGVIELPLPSGLQVRLLGEVALETAANSSTTTVQDVAFWLHRIFDPRGGSSLPQGGLP